MEPIIGLARIKGSIVLLHTINSFEIITGSSLTADSFLGLTWWPSDFRTGGIPNYYYYYYGYPNDYADYEASPVYDYRYWAGIATAVQTGLANRGYYHGSIDGAIGSGTREAIRAFQKANNLPVTGLIDPPLLKALKLPPVPQVERY